MKRLLCFFTVCVAAILVACNSAKHSGSGAETTDLAKTTTYLSAIDPGRFDNTWWNRMPYRLVQTNLREIDATMDVDAYVKSMVDASATIVLINVGGIVANYPTELPYHYRNPYMKGDLV